MTDDLSEKSARTSDSLCSAVDLKGLTAPWHAGGQEFESPWLHSKIPVQDWVSIHNLIKLLQLSGPFRAILRVVLCHGRFMSSTWDKDLRRVAKRENGKGWQSCHLSADGVVDLRHTYLGGVSK